jgi:hypothetical protein
MKDLFTPKWFSISIVLLVIIGLFFERTFEFTSLSAGLVLGIWLAITIHELGHVVLGCLVGFTFVFFTTGPFTIEKRHDRIKLTENKLWLYFGGVAMMTPPKLDNSNIIKKMTAYTAGGPAVSLITAIISVTIYRQFSFEFFTYFAMMNGAIFIATIIPINSAMKSDGHVLLTLLKNDALSIEHINDLQVTKELMSKKEPNEWDKEYILLAKQKQPKIEHIHYAMLIYYYEIQQNGFQSAVDSLKGYHSIPITTKNRFQLASLVHMQQLSLFFMSESQDEKILHLQSLLSPTEPVSFYRGKAILSYIQNDFQMAHKHLDKVKKVIEQYENTFGFYKAEKIVTQLVEEKIMSHESSRISKLIN